MSSTAQRSRTIRSATARPEETPQTGEDGFPVKVWMVDGEPVAFSLRPIPPDDRKRYWCPKGAGAKMAWKAQELNDEGYQVVIQREEWHDASFLPRNAWEEYMTLDWLSRTPGGAAAATWVGYDHPDNKPGEPKKHWICAECGNAFGVWPAFDQHQRSKSHTGIKRND